MVDEEGGKVVADEGDADVDEVPEPGGHDVALAAGRNDLDESRGEELVAVEQEVVEQPAHGRADHAAAKVARGELERLKVVARLVDPRILLRSLQGSRAVDLLVVSVVRQPESHDRHDRERDSESPLGGNNVVGRVTASVEDDQQQDQDDLVE